MNAENAGSAPDWFDAGGFKVRLRKSEIKSSVILEGEDGRRLMIFRRVDRAGEMYQVNWSMVFKDGGGLKGKIFFFLNDLQAAFRLKEPDSWALALRGGLYCRDERYLVIPYIRYRSIVPICFSLIVTDEIRDAVKEMIVISEKSGV